MGRIYSSANYVVAALTTEQPKDRKKLAKTAKAVHKAFERCLKERSTASISAASRLSSEYRLFFENPYWLRRWIIQEIIQARSVTLCCEGYQMPMSIMEGMCDGSRSRDRSRKPSGSLKDMMNSGAMRLCRLRQEMDGDSLPLEELLYTHEAAKCSDFRDQVYALLSLSEHAKNHLDVRYDIDRVELLVAVVNIAWLYEDLSPLRTLSFACFLRQHFKIKDDEIRNALLYRPRLNPEQTIGIQGVVRGIVRRHRVSVDTEDAALKFRNQVPALNANAPIQLRFHQPVHHDRNAIAPLLVVDTLVPGLDGHGVPVVVPGLDQWLFAFDGEDSRRSPKAYRARATIAGLASTRIDIGDEIWQFERAPLAFVARPTAWGYTMVGRAYLLDKLSTGCHFDDTDVRPSHWQLEDDLVWVKDARLHEVLTPIIDVDVRGLLKLVTWAIYDTASWSTLRCHDSS